MQQLLPFISNHWELFLALAVICALLIYQTFSGSSAKSISPQEAIRMINHEQAVVLDVREPSEIKTGKILDSVTVPLATLDQQIDKLKKYKDSPIIVACQSGSRSARACGILRKRGFESVYNLQGGIMAWTSANLPLSKKKS
ncbi:MAG TPA: rhodanese-like domain-containing protein [Gammaproteobacteria bacterium]|nr:rhodanese-like domain-containing protein [Gammaproteobacteria bacterium]